MAAVDWFGATAPAPAPVRRRPRPVAEPVRGARRAPQTRAAGRRLTGGIVWISLFAVLLGLTVIAAGWFRLEQGLAKRTAKRPAAEAAELAMAS